MGSQDVNDGGGGGGAFAPFYDQVIGWQGCIEPADLLFIPYGWYHQIEADGASVSASVRWNPYSDGLKKLVNARKSVETMLNMAPTVQADLQKAAAVQEKGGTGEQRTHAALKAAVSKCTGILDAMVAPLWTSLPPFVQRVWRKRFAQELEESLM